MNKIVALALITLRDALRQKLAVNLLLFAILIISASLALSRLTFGEQYRIISDLALSAASLVATLVGTFLGAALVAGDIQRRTLYPVLAKPISRSGYLLGRYLGLLVTVLLNLAVMAAATFAVLAIYREGVDRLPCATLAMAFLGIGGQVAIVCAIALFFSTFMNTTLAATCTLGVAVAGHLFRAALPYWRTTGAGRAIALAVPNLAALDYKVAVVYGDAIPVGDALLHLTYAGLYVGTVLAAAALIFTRRDLR